ncbi:hypothetical protein CPB86DRAFT_792341 [Serendipita vermifera]|nr:hypothetical protein CPB86DRAFT_792341 [Serendipita vermifera]
MKSQKYTDEDFILSFEMGNFLQELSRHGIFSRGLPSRDDLSKSKTGFAESLHEVLKAPDRFVIITENGNQHDLEEKLRRCLENGWLFSEYADGGKVRYRFASRLHELYTEWLLLRREDLIKESDLQAFVIEVIKHFSPQNLKKRNDLSDSSAAQPIPEAQFQQEFYRACGAYTGGCVTTFPECGTAKGRIDFFIRSKKWGVELLRNGIRLRDHKSRFTTGEYSNWLDEGKMEDYIMIDFRSTKPKDMSSDFKLIYVVSMGDSDSGRDWESVEIYDRKGNMIRDYKLLYH